MISRSFAMVTTFYPPENFGGDGIFVERLARGLLRRGHRVTVITCHDAYAVCGGEPVAQEPSITGPEVIRLRSPFGPISPLATQLSRDVSGSSDEAKVKLLAGSVSGLAKAR